MYGNSYYNYRNLFITAEFGWNFKRYNEDRSKKKHKKKYNIWIFEQDSTSVVPFFY